MTEKQIVKSESQDGRTTTSPRNRYRPDVDIYETDENLVLMADMPGVDEQGLQLEVARGLLTLEGRAAESGSNLREYYRQFKFGEQVDTDAGEAVLKDGVLTLRLPKLEAAKPKKIAVKTVH